MVKIFMNKILLLYAYINIIYICLTKNLKQGICHLFEIV